MSTPPTIGKALRKVRLYKGLTQEHFTDISSRTYISMLENDKKGVTVEKLHTIADAMGVHPLTILALAYGQADEGKAVELLREVVVKQIEMMKTELEASQFP